MSRIHKAKAKCVAKSKKFPGRESNPELVRERHRCYRYTTGEVAAVRMRNCSEVAYFK